MRREKEKEVCVCVWGGGRESKHTETSSPLQIRELTWESENPVSSWAGFLTFLKGLPLLIWDGSVGTKTGLFAHNCCVKQHLESCGVKPHVPYCQASVFGFGLESCQESEEGVAHLQSLSSLT